MSSSPLHTLGRYAWLAGLLLTAFSMPLWNLGMSLGQFVMAGGWLLAADLPGRVKKLVREPFFWLVSGLFFLHLIGLWNTDDFNYGMKDIRVKLPLLLMALMFSGGPELTLREYRSVFYSLITGILVSTGFGFAMRIGLTPLPVNDYRDYSHFISHIRLGLLIDFCLVVLLVSRFRRLTGLPYAAGILLAVWMIVYLLLIKSVTAFLILLVLLILMLVIQAIQTRKKLHKLFAAAAVIAALSAGAGLYHYLFIDSIRYVAYHPYPRGHHTARGGEYTSNTTRQDLEKGRLVWENYCAEEINEAWQARTGKNIREKDQLGQEFQFTIMRYLTWLNLSKDYEGIMKLSDADVLNILQGKPTPEHADNINNPVDRLHELAKEYRIWYYTGWANGQSMALRIEYVKTAKWIFTQHLLTGVGTGDLPSAYTAAYNELHSTLQPEWRLRAHNQYLTFGVAFGIPGMAFLIFVLAWLLVQSWKKENLLMAVFLVIAAISFLNEDTLETQAGVTFFAFLCGFLWRYSERTVEEKQVIQ